MQRTPEIPKEQLNQVKGKVLEYQKKLFEEELAKLKTELTETPGIDEDKAKRLIEKMEKEIKEDEPDSGVLRAHLEHLKDEISKGGYFWFTGGLKWLELFFWAIFGTFFYALMEIQRQLRLQGKFRRQTAGYISMTLRGPFVALLLIFALSTIKLHIVNVGIDLTTAPIYVWFSWLVY